MRFIDNLYVSDNIKKKSSKIINKINNDKYPNDIYIIYISNNPNEQLEIISLTMLKREHIKEVEYFVVGMSKGYDEALELVEDITKDVYKKDKNVNYKSYFLS
ncbi:MAG: hypothetical protein ACK5LL_13100 [Suipraeoptans sp.]